MLKPNKLAFLDGFDWFMSCVAQFGQCIQSHSLLLNLITWHERLQGTIEHIKHYQNIGVNHDKCESNMSQNI